MEFYRKRNTFWFFKRKVGSSITPRSHSSSSIVQFGEQKSDVSSDLVSETNQRKPVGWKAMPFIIGNESFERLGSVGIGANFIVYFLTMYNMSQVKATLIHNIWSGVGNFLPMIFAFIADAYFGKFPTIVLGTFATLLGMIMMTLTAFVPELRPPSCTEEHRILGQCRGPNANQMTFLILAMFWLAVGGGGIRPCSIPFAVDQFDPTTEKGRKGINSFFNWYYTTYTIVLIISQTLVVYVQTLNWSWGFAIPTIFMFLATILLFIGTRIYVYLKPQGSLFSSIAQVCVAAYKKRRLQLPIDHVVDGLFYDPPSKRSAVSRLPLTPRFRFLNKAALLVDNQIKPNDSCVDPWSLCSIQQVEEVKCLLNIIPVWTSSIISFLPMQTMSFVVAQALKMDRHLGPNFQIPAASVSIVNLCVMAVVLPIYDRLVPTIEKITKQEGGITLLQRIGTGNMCSVLSMVVAGFVEKKRRASAISHPSPTGVAPISVMWLVPQLILKGFFETCNHPGFTEFYNKQFPDHMRSVGNALVFFTVCVTSYLNGVLVATIDRYTGRHGPSWLTDNTNVGKLDNFYFVIAGLGTLNFIYFLFAAHGYRYKVATPPETSQDMEQN